MRTSACDRATATARTSSAVSAALAASDGGGTYHTLAAVPFDCIRDRWETFAARVANEEGGVRLTLSVAGSEVVSALDDGVGGHPALTRAGRVGVRGDNTGFRFREFVVCPAGARDSGAPSQAFCRAR